MKLVVQIVARWPWWWRFGYWPLTRFGVWLGLPLDAERVAADAMRAVKIEVEEKPAAPDDATG